jgi:hypothetical protein
MARIHRFVTQSGLKHLLTCVQRRPEAPRLYLPVFNRGNHRRSVDVLSRSDVQLTVSTEKIFQRQVTKMGLSDCEPDLVVYTIFVSDKLLALMNAGAASSKSDSFTRKDVGLQTSCRRGQLS